MAERDIGMEILEGLREIKKFKQGKVQLRNFKLSEPSSARTIRERIFPSRLLQGLWELV